MRHPRRQSASRSLTGDALAWAATMALHVLAGAAIWMPGATPRRLPPPVYKVELVAAPLPDPAAKRAPEAVERPAAQPVPVPKKVVQPKKTSVAKTPPPKEAKPDVKREPAPRTTPNVAPAPGEKPSTGSDVATVKTSGVEFPFPEYLRNLVAQVYRRWQRPTENVILQAEVLFLVHRDGSVSGLQFVRRSGNFAFDLEAQGAVEAASTAHAFGQLPDGYPADVLPVSFFFNPSAAR
ncbi:MAG: hypothetical protein EXR93_00640 [Gemmatimonadetes bacterium]|nr:hypothetical protein [Gemmatimonadota bacterium]